MQNASDPLFVLTMFDLMYLRSLFNTSAWKVKFSCVGSIVFLRKTNHIDKIGLIFLTTG